MENYKVIDAVIRKLRMLIVSIVLYVVITCRSGMVTISHTYTSDTFTVSIREQFR